MKDSEVYLEAAQKIRRHRYSCNAIDEVCRVAYSRQRKRYERLFAPTPAPVWDAWLDQAADNGLIKFSELHKWRVLALLFMHQIAKDEERS